MTNPMANQKLPGRWTILIKTLYVSTLSSALPDGRTPSGAPTETRLRPDIQLNML